MYSKHGKQFGKFWHIIIWMYSTRKIILLLLTVNIGLNSCAPKIERNLISCDGNLLVVLCFVYACAFVCVCVYGGLTIIIILYWISLIFYVPYLYLHLFTLDRNWYNYFIIMWCITFGNVGSTSSPSSTSSRSNSSSNIMCYYNFHNQNL